MHHTCSILIIIRLTDFLKVNQPYNDDYVHGKQKQLLTSWIINFLFTSFFKWFTSGFDTMFFVYYNWMKKYQYIFLLLFTINEFLVSFKYQSFVYGIIEMETKTSFVSFLKCSLFTISYYKVINSFFSFLKLV